MRNYWNTIVIVLALLAAFPALSAEYSDLYIIPVAGHTQGAQATQWRTDVVLHNLQRAPISVEMLLIESGRSPLDQAKPVFVGAETTLHVAPGETRTLSDVLGQQDRENLVGAIVVGADAPFVVTSRTYARLPAGRTLGQTVLPMAISAGADTVSDSAVLAGLTESDRQRSNVGVFVAASHAPFIVEIELAARDGAKLGSRLVVLDEAGFIHQQFAVAQIAGNADGASAVVRVLQGDGVVVPYASIIDNASAEAIFVSGHALAGRGDDARMMLRGLCQVRPVSASGAKSSLW